MGVRTEGVERDDGGRVRVAGGMVSVGVEIGVGVGARDVLALEGEPGRSDTIASS